jgi:MFS family permease
MPFSFTPWLVAALAFVVLGFSRGLHSSFGVFNVALLDSFNWSRGATAGIFSIVLTVDAMLSPVVGYLLDRYGTKKSRDRRLHYSGLRPVLEQPGERALAIVYLLWAD